MSYVIICECFHVFFILFILFPSFLLLFSPFPLDSPLSAERLSAKRDTFFAPLWVPDSTATSCMVCSAEFSLVRRRHHCRICGALSCNSCSPKRRVAWMDEARAVRVCTVCEKKEQLSMEEAFRALDVRDSDSDSDVEEGVEGKEKGEGKVEGKEKTKEKNAIERYERERERERGNRREDGYIWDV